MNRSADILVRFWGRRNAKADKNVRAPEKCEMRTTGTGAPQNSNH